jgi:hypothetical protein
MRDKINTFGPAVTVTLIFSDECHREAWMLRQGMLESEPMRLDYYRVQQSTDIPFIIGVEGASLSSTLRRTGRVPPSQLTNPNYKIVNPKKLQVYPSTCKGCQDTRSFVMITLVDAEELDGNTRPPASATGRWTSFFKPQSRQEPVQESWHTP